MKPYKVDEYILNHTRGIKAWTCYVKGSKSVGWGTRPDLAIRDWKKQDKLARKE